MDSDQEVDFYDLSVEDGDQDVLVNFQEDGIMTQEELFEVAYIGAVNEIILRSPEGLLKCISLLGVENLDIEDINETMTSFILLCFKVGAPEMVPVLFEAFDDDNSVVNTRPSATTFFTISDPTLTPEVYRFVAEATEEKDNYGTHIYNLLDYASDEGVMRAVEKLDVAYGQQPYDFYDQLLTRINKLDELKGTFNTVIFQYAAMKYAELEEYADIPQDIIRSVVLPTERSLAEYAVTVKAKPRNIPSINETTMMMVTDLDIRSAVSYNNRDEIYNEIKEELSSMSNEAYKELAKKYTDILAQTELQFHEELFRIYGPSYPVEGYSNLAENSDDSCNVYGGCRMLLCNGHTPRTDVEDIHEWEEIDWFTESCCKCKKKIRFRHLAKRMPLPGGGWDTDSYCSWECVRDDIMEPDVIQTLLTNYFEKKSLRIGIYDRTYLVQVDLDDASDLAPGYFESLAGFPLMKTIE